MDVLVASKLFDLQGYAELEVAPESATSGLQRRFNKVATLDLGAAINDRGFSDSDREFTFAYTNQSEELDAALERLVRFHPRVWVSMRDGFFECAPIALDRDASRPTFTVSVIQRIGE